MQQIRPLSEKLQLKAITELHEVPSRVDEDIAALRTWIEKQPHLNACTDDQFLITFLRGCKFSLEKAKNKIDKYYTLRTAYEGLLTCRNIEDQRVRDIFALGVTLILPNPLGEDGPRIMMFRPGCYTTDKYTMADIATTSTAIQDILLREDDNMAVSGYVQIMDFTNATPVHFFQMTPILMKKFSTFSEEALPLRLNATLILPNPLGEDGPRIMIFRPGCYNTNKYSAGELIIACAAMQDIVMREDDNMVIGGYVQIMDFTNATPAHFFQLSPSVMKKLSTFSEEALPFRMKSTHCINVPSGFEYAFSVIKPLLSPKLQSRLYAHGTDLEPFYKHVPRKYLPKEYGGENGSIQEITEYWCQNVQDHADFYKHDAQYRTNEALRVGKRIDYDSVFGMEGSFRKLAFD